jgi:large subunit ribosomal protein L19
MEHTKFNVGDTIVVNYQVIEGNKTRIQPFTGIVIGKRGSGNNKTFTVRRMAVGQIGVERIFREISPKIIKIEVIKSAKVRRAKLNYIRKRVGKAASNL